MAASSAIAHRHDETTVVPEPASAWLAAGSRWRGVTGAAGLRHDRAPSWQQVVGTLGAVRAARARRRALCDGMLDRDYRWGGRQPDSGFDCSGLRHVFREAAGLELQGNAAALARQSRPVDPGALQAGDPLFFNTLGQPSSHVGVYVGQGQFCPCGQRAQRRAHQPPERALLRRPLRGEPNPAD